MRCTDVVLRFVASVFILDALVHSAKTAVYDSVTFDAGETLSVDTNNASQILIDNCVGAGDLTLVLNDKSLSGTLLLVAVTNTTVTGTVTFSMNATTANVRANISLLGGSFGAVIFDRLHVTNGSISVRSVVTDAVTVQRTLFSSTSVVIESNELALTQLFLGDRVVVDSTQAWSNSSVAIRNNTIVAPYSTVCTIVFTAEPPEVYNAVRWSLFNATDSELEIATNHIVPITGPFGAQGCSSRTPDGLGVGIQLPATVVVSGQSSLKLINNSIAMGAVGGTAIVMKALFLGSPFVAVELLPTEPTLDVTLAPSLASEIGLLQLGSWTWPCRTLTLIVPDNTPLLLTATEILFDGQFTSVSLSLGRSPKDVYEVLVLSATVQVSTDVTLASMLTLKTVMLGGNVDTFSLINAPALQKVILQTGATITSFSVENATMNHFVGMPNVTLSMVSILAVTFVDSGVLTITGCNIDQVLISGSSFVRDASIIIENNTMSTNQFLLANRIDLNALAIGPGSSICIRNNVITAPYSSVCVVHFTALPTEAFTAITLSVLNMTRSTLCIVNNAIVQISAPFSSAPIPGCTSRSPAPVGTGIDVAATVTLTEGSSATVSNNSIAMGAVGATAVTLTALFLANSSLAFATMPTELTLDVVFALHPMSSSLTIVQLGPWTSCQALTIRPLPNNTALRLTDGQSLLLNGTFATVSIEWSPTLGDAYSRLEVANGATVKSLTVVALPALEGITIRNATMQSVSLSNTPMLSHVYVEPGASIAAKLEVATSAELQSFAITNATVSVVQLSGVVVEGVVSVVGCRLDQFVLHASEIRLGAAVVIANNSFSATPQWRGNRIEFSELNAGAGSSLCVEANTITAPFSNSCSIFNTAQPPEAYVALLFGPAVNVSFGSLLIADNSIVPMAVAPLPDGCWSRSPANVGVGIEISSSVMFLNGSTVMVEKNNIDMGAVGASAYTATPLVMASYYNYTNGSFLEPGLAVIDQLQPASVTVPLAMTAPSRCSRAVLQTSPAPPSATSSPVLLWDPPCPGSTANASIRWRTKTGSVALTLPSRSLTISISPAVARHQPRTGTKVHRRTPSHQPLQRQRPSVTKTSVALRPSPTPTVPPSLNTTAAPVLNKPLSVNGSPPSSKVPGAVAASVVASVMSGLIAPSAASRPSRLSSVTVLPICTFSASDTPTFTAYPLQINAIQWTPKEVVIGALINAVLLNGLMAIALASVVVAAFHYCSESF